MAHELGSNDDDYQSNPMAYSLEHLRQAGVPLGMQLSPYLQVDPSIFRNSEPQYIMPQGSGPKRGALERSFGQIGGAIGIGYIGGVVRGVGSELFNIQTTSLNWNAWITRVVNAAVKHGSAFAQPAGVAVLTYSSCTVFMGLLRPDDELNSLTSGIAAGSLFRCGHGLRSAIKGGFVGGLLAALWTLKDSDGRDRIKQIARM